MEDMPERIIKLDTRIREMEERLAYLDENKRVAGELPYPYNNYYKLSEEKLYELKGEQIYLKDMLFQEIDEECEPILENIHELEAKEESELTEQEEIHLEIYRRMYNTKLEELTRPGTTLAPAHDDFYASVYNILSFICLLFGTFTILLGIILFPVGIYFGRKATNEGGSPIPYGFNILFLLGYLLLFLMFIFA